MAEYDVLVALNDTQLNDASSVIYEKVYPTGKLFRGSGTITEGGLTFDVSYDCQQAPTFDLTPPSPESIASQLVASLPLHAQKVDRDDVDGLVELAANQPSFFSVTFGDLEFTFSSKDDPAVKLTTDVTLLCQVTTVDGSAQFKANSATAPKQPSPVAEMIVEHFILPTIVSVANSLFQGLTIPPLSMPGVPLSAPVLLVSDGRIYAASSVEPGTPSLPSAPAGPDATFFILLGQGALQAATSHFIAKSGAFSKSAKKGSDAFEAYYSFSYRLTDPVVTLDGVDLVIDFDLSGSITAGVHVFWVPIGLGYKAVSTPTPQATCALVSTGSSLEIVEKSLRPFTLAVVPTGSIPTKVLSWMTEFIVAGIVAALTPLITTFIKDLKISTLAVPSYTESIEGVDVTFAPADLTVGSEAGMISLAGTLSVT